MQNKSPVMLSLLFEHGKKHSKCCEFSYSKFQTLIMGRIKRKNISCHECQEFQALSEI